MSAEIVTAHVRKVLHYELDHFDGAELERVIREAYAAGKPWHTILMAAIAALPRIVGVSQVPAAEAALLPVHLLAASDPAAPAAPPAPDPL